VTNPGDNDALAMAARKVARGVVDWVDIQWSVIVRLLKDVAPRAHGRLLDVGCGEKPYEGWFRPYVTSYTGIEHAATFAMTAAGQRSRADVVYDGTSMPFRDGTFDTVLSVQVLEHTPRPGALVKEMARVLAPEGLLILTAPFSFRVHEQPHDYFRFTYYGLKRLCDDAGLEIVETFHQGSLWSVLGHKLNTYLAFRVARVGRAIQHMG
jgi:SAM-dependent methyltransferase